MTRLCGIADPDKFPASFHQALQAPGLHQLAVGTKKRMVSRQNEFSSFKTSLRRHPLHPLHQAPYKFLTRTQIRPLLDPGPGGQPQFELLVRVEPADGQWELRDSIRAALRNDPLRAIARPSRLTTPNRKES